MAKVLTESGRYLADKSYDNSRKMIIAAYAGACVTMFIFGFWIAYKIWGPKPSILLSLSILLLVLLSFALIYRFVNRKMVEFDKARTSYLKGATGEAIIARTIALLPDEYMVINDLQTPYGNLDHVVIGPKGVFIVETKNWKGLVDTDENGGLLWNEQRPTDSPVKTVIGRMMEVRKKVAVLCDAKDVSKFYYFKAVVAFPSAFVRAKWGKTGNADCVTGDTIEKYITTSLTERPLAKEEIRKLASAFLALATMSNELKTTPSTDLH